MLQRRPAGARGHFDHGWLDTWHSFSFAEYFDPEHTRYSALRVINDDRIAAGAGFPLHPHQDMEILTYVLEGELEHRDSLGHTGRLRPGEVQYMRAGRGIRHSEYNASPDQPLHLLQIWIEPAEHGLEPGYSQRPFPLDERTGEWVLLAAPDGVEGALPIHQDTRVYATRLPAGATLEQAADPARHYYLHLARGRGELNGEPLEGGDGARITGEHRLALHALEPAEALLFDLP